MNNLYSYLFCFVALNPLGLFSAASNPNEIVPRLNLKSAGSRILGALTPRRSSKRKSRSSKRKKRITLKMQQKRAEAERGLVEAQTVLISRRFIISEVDEKSFDALGQGVLERLMAIYKDYDHASTQRSRALNLLCAVVQATQDETPMRLLRFMINERESLENSSKLVDSVRHGRINQALAWGLFAK